MCFTVCRADFHSMSVGNHIVMTGPMLTQYAAMSGQRRKKSCLKQVENTPVRPVVPLSPVPPVNPVRTTYSPYIPGHLACL